VKNVNFVPQGHDHPLKKHPIIRIIYQCESWVSI
jgi:hypothetical protein